jgi:hypothetical protein
MPTVFKLKSYRFFFYSSDKEEPPHIHVESGDKVAKFWLDPVRLQSSGGFNRTEINKIHKMILRHQVKLLEVWNEYFGY